MTKEKQPTLKETLDTTKKLIEVMGEDSSCSNDKDGLFCVNQEKGKIYQVTREGTSVAKVNVNPPESYDVERNGLLIKQLDENCKISTSKGNEGEEKSKGSTILMCYKENDDSNLRDVGATMESMDKKLDEVSKGI